MCLRSPRLFDGITILCTPALAAPATVKNAAEFRTVRTDAVRLVVECEPDLSAGVYEWRWEDWTCRVLN